MKPLKSLIALSLFGLAGAASADDAFSYDDWARVTRVTPQYERVNVPSRECRTEVISSREPVYSQPQQRSVAGAVIGGVTGGIVGNQVGKGSGRAAATAAGALIGAIVGDRIDNGDSYSSDSARRVEYYEPREREINRCRVIDRWENRLTGYLVDYEYHGRSYSRMMNEDPGRRMKVRVSVEPE